jgi:hypothetical protein
MEPTELLFWWMIWFGWMFDDSGIVGLGLFLWSIVMFTQRLGLM